MEADVVEWTSDMLRTFRGARFQFVGSFSLSGLDDLAFSIGD